MDKTFKLIYAHFLNFYPDSNYFIRFKLFHPYKPDALDVNGMIVPLCKLH